MSTVQKMNEYNADSTEYSDGGVICEGSVCTSVRSSSAQKQVLMPDIIRSKYFSNIPSAASDYQVTVESRDIPNLGENTSNKED